MADIKRDFLYEFNRELRKINSDSSSIVSVFESIDSGALRLSPVEVPYADFIDEVGKCIFIIKKIVADPYKSVEGKQELVPVSQAQNMNQESIKLTLSDTSVWATESGKRIPKLAYSLANEYVYTSYENAFVCTLIKLLIPRLKKIKAKVELDFPDKTAWEYLQLNSTIDSYIRKLTRLSNEKVFVDNNRRVVDMSDIYITDIIASDYKYNYCYRFFVDNFKNNKSNNSIGRDFRVLYHNFALIQILYALYKSGYTFDDVEYYVSVSGKAFINPVNLSGEKEIAISQRMNGIDIACNNKLVRVEFSKALIKDSSAILEHFVENSSKIREENKYSNVYVAYLSSEDSSVDGVLSIGYKNAEKAIDKLINSL